MRRWEGCALRWCEAVLAALDARGAEAAEAFAAMPESPQVSDSEAHTMAARMGVRG
ncbi:MAG TPA: hypothetical protein VG366_06980 [Solirubrobacteraceae bacterium]|nr:hypothetical protein [Solirubrobacteraceae bacterium]